MTEKCANCMEPVNESAQQCPHCGAVYTDGGRFRSFISTIRHRWILILGILAFVLAGPMLFGWNKFVLGIGVVWIVILLLAEYL